MGHHPDPIGEKPYCLSRRPSAVLSQDQCHSNSLQIVQVYNICVRVQTHKSYVSKHISRTPVRIAFNIRSTFTQRTYIDLYCLLSMEVGLARVYVMTNVSMLHFSPSDAQAPTLVCCQGHAPLSTAGGFRFTCIWVSFSLLVHASAASSLALSIGPTLFSPLPCPVMISIPDSTSFSI